MAPRPVDEDEDWEDDFADFKAAAPPVTTDAGAVPTADDDFGSFTQISMPDGGADAVGPEPVPIDDSVTPTTRKDSSLHGGPIVETVGDFSEFSQSEVADDTGVGISVATETGRCEEAAFENKLDENDVVETSDPRNDKPLDAIDNSSIGGEQKTDIPYAGNDDSFGDFGGIKSPTPSENNDEFSPGLTSQVGVDSIDEKPSQPSEADFMASAGFEVAEFPAATSSPSAPMAKESVDNNCENFGDSGTLCTSESNAPLAVRTVDNDDSFGDFGTAQVETSSDPIPGGRTDSKDTCGDVEIIQAGETVMADTVLVKETTGNDDSFGDFGSAQMTNSSTDEPHLTNENTACDEPRTDDFDDFGATETTPPPVDAVDQSNGDDGFGDFGPVAVTNSSKQSSHVAGMSAEEESLDTPPLAPTDVSAAVAATTDDDFGDFGNADGATRANDTDRNEESSDGIAIDFDPVNRASTANNENVFGAEERVQASHEVDGPDFGAAEPAPTSVDDDFGDFDAAEPPPTADDDDFGDFDAAEPPPTADDDDFGDFDAAEPPPTANSGNINFGDFNDVGDAPGLQKVSLPPQHRMTSLSASDPTLQHVAAAMHRVFQKPPRQIDLDADADSDGVKIKKSSLQELMKSMQSEESPSRDSDELPSFRDMLKQSEFLRKRGPEIIVTGKPPYKLHYPLHGFTSIHETKKPPEMRRASIPPVLDVKLHALKTESETSSRSSEPIEICPPVSDPSSSQALEASNGGTLVKLPPKNTAEDPALVENFLKKIPNLSFMLSPKLSLPAQS